MDCSHNSNPFIGESSKFSPQERQKFQSPRGRNCFENPIDGSIKNGRIAIAQSAGDAYGRSEDSHNITKNDSSGMTTNYVTTTTTTTTQHRLNLRTLAPFEDNVEEKIQQTTHDEFTHNESLCNNVPTNGKASYEKNLGKPFQISFTIFSFHFYASLLILLSYVSSGCACVLRFIQQPI